MLVHEYLNRAAARLPDKVALVSASQRLTYMALKTGADAFSAYLAAIGLAKGDRVAVYLDNSPEAVIAIFGTLQEAGCLVIINPATQAERFGVIPKKFTPKFLTTDAVYELRMIGAPDPVLGQAIKARSC